nr:MAG TPA: hypothetical protein [Caudoviricetes sp.]
MHLIYLRGSTVRPLQTYCSAWTLRVRHRW